MSAWWSFYSSAIQNETLDSQHIFRVGNYTRFRWGYVLYTLLHGTCFGRPCQHTAHGQWQTFDAADTNVTFSLCLFQSSATDHPLWVLPVSVHYKVTRSVRWSPLSPQLYQACCSPHSNQSISKQSLYTVCVLGEGGVWSWALTLIMFCEGETFVISSTFQFPLWS